MFTRLLNKLKLAYKKGDPNRPPFENLF